MFSWGSGMFAWLRPAALQAPVDYFIVRPVAREVFSTFLGEQWPSLTLLVKEREAERINYPQLLICLQIKF